MSDILKQIQALQEQFNNLLGEELEKEGPKGEIKDLSRPPKKDYFDKKIEVAKANFRTADKVARNNWKKFQASDDIDSSGYSDSYADARTADNEREKALDNYEYTKKEMDAARKGKRIEPKSTMEQIRRIRARREGAIKMNDNNSYNEIVSQIMDLKEAFSNLFEVDDLGQPAMDVPPSQNKIKRDRKTKDGKVELVSVEDELFPYEGNKREQYRQKILDTINNMIQGKATLEDLLQIVRQKKAPLKEAMEVLETVFSQIEKVHGDPVWRNTRVGFVPMNKSAELQDKADKNAYDEFQQARKRENKSEEELDKKRNETKNNPLEEAMEVLEDIYTMIDKKYPEGSREKSLLKIKAQNNRLRSYHDMDSRKPINGENSIDKAIGAYTKNAKGNAKTDSRRDVVDQEYVNLDRENDPEGKKATQKSIDRHFDKVLYKPLKSQANITRKAVATEKFKRMNSEALEEAMELMEELLLERNKENRDKKEKWELKTNSITKKYKKAIQDYAKQEGDEAKHHKAAAADYDRIYSQQPAQSPDGSPNSVAAYFNGKYQEMLRNKGRNEQNIADEVEPLTKKLKNRKHSFHDRVRGWTESEALEEALSLTEEIINEVSVKKWKEAAKNSIEGRKEAASDASDRLGEVVYPFRGEVNDPGHKLGNAWDKAEQRADRAEQLAKNLPDSNKSATKLKQAAKKVVDKRDKDNEEAVDKLQGAVDKLKEKPYDERTDKDYSDLAKVQNEWVGKQKKENQARNLVGKPERRPEKNSEGKHELKEQGFIDRSNEA